MQSGITASAQLHEAFNTFTSDTSLFALPITISSEALVPLSAIKFQSSSFTSSLASLSPHLEPRTPIYLVIRTSPNKSTDLVAITYVPSVAPVRSKTLFASTRASLVRDLGLEKFVDTIFVTDADEVLDPRQWDDRAGTVSPNGIDTGILSTEERELQGVKRAEDEERHGTAGRDLMGKGGSGSSLKMKTTDDARKALAQLSEEGSFVQLGIDVSTETLQLLSAESQIDAGSVQAKISQSRPTYSFYHYPGTESVIFAYTCPGASKVKERMVYASSRGGVLELAQVEGVVVTKRIEAGDPNEITKERLADEAGLKASESQSASSRTGFAKPKRPGRR